MSSKTWMVVNILTLRHFNLIPHIKAIKHDLISSLGPWHSLKAAPGRQFEVPLMCRTASQIANKEVWAKSLPLICSTSGRYTNYIVRTLLCLV